MSKFTINLLGEKYTLPEEKCQILLKEGCSPAIVRAYTKYYALAKAAEHGSNPKLWEVEWKYFTNHGAFGLAMVAINIVAKYEY